MVRKILQKKGDHNRFLCIDNTVYHIGASLKDLGKKWFAFSRMMVTTEELLENLIVIHDDMDLPNGSERTKIGGGSAGHNGIKSIDAAVGNEYKRIRIGIGHPRDFESPISPSDWVLGRFSDEQLVDIKKTIGELKVF